MILKRKLYSSKSSKNFSALDNLENFQNKVQDSKIRLNKKVLGNSKLGKMSRNNLEVERAQMTNGTKNLKILLGKD